MSGPSYLIWCWGWTGVLVCSRIQRPRQALKQSETLRLEPLDGGGGEVTGFALHSSVPRQAKKCSLGTVDWGTHGVQVKCLEQQVGRTLFVVFCVYWLSFLHASKEQMGSSRSLRIPVLSPRFSLSGTLRQVKKNTRAAITVTQVVKVTGNCESGRSWGLTFAKVSQAWFTLSNL